MNKNISKMIAIGGISFLLLPTLQNCYGTFTLTKKVYQWNGSLRSYHKFVPTIVMWILMLGVYEACGVVDLFLLNTIEFWTGSNPLAMNDGESESQIVERDGKRYEIIATRNRFDVYELNANARGQKASLVYDESARTWSTETSAGTHLVARESKTEAGMMEIIANGQVVATKPVF